MYYLIMLTGFIISMPCFSQSAKINLEKNMRMNIKNEVQVNLIYEIAGTAIENNNYKIKYQQLELINKQDDVFDVTLSVKKLVVKLKYKNDELVFDSEKNDNPLLMAEAYNKEANYLTNAKIKSNGYLRTGDSQSVNSVLSIDPMTSNIVTGCIPVLHTTINSRILKKGDKWNDSITSVIAGIKSDINGMYTVGETVNSETTIEFTGTQKISGVIKQGNNEINSGGDCTIMAEITIDMKTGLIVKLFATYEGVIFMDISGVFVPVTIKTVNQLEAKLL